VKQVTITRYYSHGKELTLEAALNKIKDLQERHPDREYTLFNNARAVYRRVQVVQVKRVTLDVLEEGIDYHLLPRPVPRTGQTYGDHVREMAEWREDCEKRKGPDPT
jgi:hypothetical protein